MKKSRVPMAQFAVWNAKLVHDFLIATHLHPRPISRSESYPLPTSFETKRSRDFAQFSSRTHPKSLSWQERDFSNLHDFRPFSCQEKGLGDEFLKAKAHFSQAVEMWVTISLSRERLPQLARFSPLLFSREGAGGGVGREASSISTGG